MSRRIVWVMTLMVVIMGLSGVEHTFAQRTVGVSVGFSGEACVVYSGNATMPPPDQMMEWVKVTVQGISGTNITFQQKTCYADMHEVTYTYFIDVETGQGNATGSFIAANLTEGDLIYTSPSLEIFQGATINETIFREYLGASVEVNHFGLAITQTIPGQGNFTIAYDYYWNRATGAGVEVSYYELLQPDEGDTIWMEWRLKIIGLGEIFHVVVDSVDYAVTMSSNSTITNFVFDQSGKKVNFNVTGHMGETGYCNVSFPESLLWGVFSVYKDGSPLVEDVDYTQTHNGTHYTFHITYTHSTHIIEIVGTGVIPEFPSLLILPLFMITTLLAVIVYRRKQSWM